MYLELKMQCLKQLKIILQYSIYILLILSLIYSYIYNINYKSKYTTENTLYGYITYYYIDGNKLSLEIKGKEKLLGIYYFKDINDLNNFKIMYKLGDYVKLKGKLQMPNENTIFNNFNYKKYLKYEQINFVFNIDSINKIKNNDKVRYTIKNAIIKRIDNNINKEYLYTFILGNSKYIDSKVMESYRNNGISHLFSVSGMHVSLISMIILKVFDKFKFKNILVMFIILFYMFLTDFSPSILRAGIFYIILTINKKLNLKISNINLMILLLSICIFIDPYILNKVGFLYSYIISFSLIYFNKLINNKNSKIYNLFIISLISFLVSMPITINNFYEINFLSIILNIFFVSIVSSFLFPITLLSVIIPIPFLNNFIDIFENISLLISKIDFFTLVLCKMNIFFIVMYYIVILYILNNFRYKKLVMLLIIIFIHLLIPYFNNEDEIIFVDVGQGDSIFVKLKNNSGNILIDTGGKIKYKKDEWKDVNSNYNLSSNIITYIKSLGINKLDYLILTHGDYDHMGESINLVENFKVEKVIFNCGKFNELEQELIKVLEKKKIPYYSCIKELNIDNNKLYFLNNKDYGNENDNSNVIYTELDNHKFLFMGDAGVEVEEDLIEKYNLTDIDVLKVGHHGSKTSSNKKFIDDIDLKYSVISVGKNNRYGHPNESVLDNLETSKVYRTDQDGSIMFKIKNNKLQIETCTP